MGLWAENTVALIFVVEEMGGVGRGGVGWVGVGWLGAGWSGKGILV